MPSLKPSCGSLTSPIRNLNDEGDDDVGGDDPASCLLDSRFIFLHSYGATPYHYSFFSSSLLYLICDLVL